MTSSAQAAPYTWRARGPAAGSRGSRKAANEAASTDISSRAYEAGPRLLSIVCLISVPLSAWPSPAPAPYGPCSSSPSRVEISSPSELPNTSRRAPLRFPPAGQQVSRNATPPPSTAKHRYSSHRTTANRPLTRPLVGGRRAATWVALGAPTENVNAPSTGCVSAEMTCQTAV